MQPIIELRNTWSIINRTKRRKDKCIIIFLHSVSDRNWSMCDILVTLFISYVTDVYWTLPSNHRVYMLSQCTASCSWCMCVLVTQSCSRVRFFAILWTIAHQAPLSMEFSRQKYWRGLPFPSLGDLLNPGIEPRSPALWTD